jgi:hypothetical protein
VEGRSRGIGVWKDLEGWSRWNGNGSGVMWGLVESSGMG